jgi:acetate kinase
MKILVLNAGSSSLKFQLFDMERGAVLASGLIEQIGEANGYAKLKYQKNGNEEALEKKEAIADHHAGLEIAGEMLADCGLLADFGELDAIGHRVVHGGELFRDAAIIDDMVIDAIEKVSALAPLHNPANLAGIKVAISKAPNVPQVAVFDTAFHQSIPDYAYMYALPYELYEKYGVRRYGFHGTSHFFVAKEAAKFLGKSLENTNLITLHLGNGASLCAIENGQSIDTSMGMTPLEGVIMGTRSGDIDPQIIFFLAKQAGKSFEQIDKMLNKESGLKGICGANDVREIIAMSEKGDERAKLALAMFSYRIKKYIGSYAAILGRVDAVVFTGGIGEHSPLLREMMMCGKLEESLGLRVDIEKDHWDKHEPWDASMPGGKIKMLIVPTNEELEIATQTKRLVGENS